MWLQREPRRNLAIESDATFEATNGGEKAVEVTSTTPNPTTVKRESYAGHKAKVQFV